MKVAPKEIDRLCRLVADHASRNNSSALIVVCSCDLCTHAYKVIDAYMTSQPKKSG